jgi:hypothetical protein
VLGVVESTHLTSFSDVSALAVGEEARGRQDRGERTGSMKILLTRTLDLERYTYDVP